MRRTKCFSFVYANFVSVYFFWLGLILFMLLCLGFFTERWYFRVQLGLCDMFFFFQKIVGDSISNIHIYSDSEEEEQPPIDHGDDPMLMGDPPYVPR